MAGIESWIVSKKIEDWRRIIDAVDVELTRLLNKRTKCALEIGKIKATEGLPIYDPEREEAVIKNVQALAGEHLDDETIRRLFERIIDETRRSERTQSLDGRSSVTNRPRKSKS